MPKLIWMHHGAIIGERTLGDGPIRIGRAQGNDICPDDPTVSRQHATVTWKGGSAVVQDLGSRNGTRVNGARIEQLALRHGDVIEVGRHQIRYDGGESSQSGETVVLRVEALPTGAAAAQSRPVASIRVLAGAEAGRIVKLEKPYTPVGTLGHRVVVIARRGESYTVLGFGSGTGVIVINGQPLSRGSHLLQDRDIIELADTRLEFTLAAPPCPAP